jgi:hypothetical protein
MERPIIFYSFLAAFFLAAGFAALVGFSVSASAVLAFFEACLGAGASSSATVSSSFTFFLLAFFLCPGQCLLLCNCI